MWCAFAEVALVLVFLFGLTPRVIIGGRRGCERAYASRRCFVLNVTWLLSLEVLWLRLDSSESALRVEAALWSG